jgi:transposase
LCYQALGQLKVAEFLRNRGWEEEQIGLALTHIISRAANPASELKTAMWIKENSAVCELTGYDARKITKDKLYGIARKLYAEKEAMEGYLSRLTNDLFSLTDKIILYDLTNTYFEGRMLKSNVAKFGRSKEKRNDAKLIVLALVINMEGFVKYSDIFEGSTADSTTLKGVIDRLNFKAGYAGKKPIVVMDAGIATVENLAYLREMKFDYLCVSRSTPKDFEAQTKGIPVEVKDNKKQPIQLLCIADKEAEDSFLWVKSEAKGLKENAMRNHRMAAFEDELAKISKATKKKGGIKQVDKVWVRIGRLREKYPSINKFYEIALTDDGKGIVTEVICKKQDNINDDAGIYFLRTTRNGKSEADRWEIYNAIREIEYTFRVLKTDLDLRPIYHKTDEASMAHLNLGLLAYWVVSTIRYQLKQKGCNLGWTEILRIASTQKRVTTTVQDAKGQTIAVRKCSEPEEKLTDIYVKLKYKPIPIPQKKYVWTTGAHPKNQDIDFHLFNDS